MRLYDLQRWRRLSKRFLVLNPMCAMCEDDGRITVATVVDHTIPHKGNIRLFFDENNLKPLCKYCHDSHKAAQERSGKVRGCDENGRPLDPNHPWNTDDDA